MRQAETRRAAYGRRGQPPPQRQTRIVGDARREVVRAHVPPFRPEVQDRDCCAADHVGGTRTTGRMGAGRRANTRTLFGVCGLGEHVTTDTPRDRGSGGSTQDEWRSSPTPSCCAIFGQSPRPGQNLGNLNIMLRHQYFINQSHYHSRSRRHPSGVSVCTRAEQIWSLGHPRLTGNVGRARWSLVAASIFQI